MKLHIQLMTMPFNVYSNKMLHQNHFMFVMSSTGKQSSCYDRRKGSVFQCISRSHREFVRNVFSFLGRFKYYHVLLNTYQRKKLQSSEKILYLMSQVQIPLTPTFYSYFKESFSGEYHINQFLPLHSCDYPNKILIKTNMATDEGSS